MEKSTNGFEKRDRIELFQSLMKQPDGNYIAVLSDDSIDRDGDIIGKAALNKVINEDDGVVSILVDHENKVNNLVGEWVNRRMEVIDGHNALVAEPKFYLSNPQAQMIKGMLDDGAQMGISIGAISRESKKVKINGKTHTEFTALELLEASFVAIPANKHAHAVAIAKSLSLNKPKEVTKMDKVEQIEKKLYDEMVAKNLETTKDLESLQKEFDVFKTESEELLNKQNGVVEGLNKELEANVIMSKDLEASNDKVEQLTKQIEELTNKQSVFKAQGEEILTKQNAVNIDGALPVIFK